MASEQRLERDRDERRPDMFTTAESGSGSASIYREPVNVTNAQSIVVTLHFVQDSAGHASNAVNAQMSVLIGDVGANGNVGSGDVSQVKGQVGHLVTTANFRDDVNHDGVINTTDVSIVQNQRGSSLPQ